MVHAVQKLWPHGSVAGWWRRRRQTPHSKALAASCVARLASESVADTAAAAADASAASCIADKFRIDAEHRGSRDEHEELSYLIYEAHGQWGRFCVESFEQGCLSTK